MLSKTALNQASKTHIGGFVGPVQVWSEVLAAGSAAQWLWPVHGLDVYDARWRAEGCVTAASVIFRKANQTSLCFFFTFWMLNFSCYLQI